MSYLEESLSAGEQVQHRFALHWMAWLPMVFWLLLGPVTFGITWGIAIYEYLRLTHIELGVTNKRVVFKSGIIGRHSEEMKLTSIETVEIDQGVWGRLLGFGTIKVTGRGLSDVVYAGVRDPMAVKRQIESISNPVP